jgi:Spy/CpxP family protein refolding chaperone
MIRLRASLAVYTLLVLVAGGSVASAQGERTGAPPVRKEPLARGGANRDLRGRAARGQLGDSTTPAEKQALVRQIRQAFGGVVRRQLNLDNEKWSQFQRVDQRFQQQRNQLQRGERETRLALKAAMEDTAGVDQNKIAQYLSELTQGQRRRADLLDAEQKELSGFLTPLQRAKLQALREQLNRRVALIQQQGALGGRRIP